MIARQYTVYYTFLPDFVQFSRLSYAKTNIYMLYFALDSHFLDKTGGSDTTSTVGHRITSKADENFRTKIHKRKTYINGRKPYQSRCYVQLTSTLIVFYCVFWTEIDRDCNRTFPKSIYTCFVFRKK